MAGRADRFRMPAIGAVDAAPRRKPGPMGVAARETAENVAAATEAQVEARRRNAADAREWRAAAAEGRVLVAVPLDEIRADDLPRDRLDLEAAAMSEEMEELKTSIRARGQREPIELYRDAGGRLQIKKGWRRITALRALRAETGDARFATALARVDEAGGEAGETARIGLYVDMVEENAVREDLTFSEMAQLVIAARDDPRTGFSSYDEALGRLYGALHRMKRSNIKQFVTLLVMLGDALKWPKAIGRDLGANVGRKLRAERALGARLRAQLSTADTPERQNAILRAALTPPRPVAPSPRRFTVDGMRATVSAGACRITLPDGAENADDAQIEAALAAFRAALDG